MRPFTGSPVIIILLLDQGYLLQRKGDVLNQMQVLLNPCPLAKMFPVKICQVLQFFPFFSHSPVNTIAFTM